MNGFYDPFGFTKQTATLLRGLGVPEIISECKKRNISTDVLHQLSTQELIMLGADPKKAEVLQNTLNVKKKRSGIVAINIEDRFKHLIEIIKNGEQQFSLIHAFVVYCRLRLVKERINIFVDPNKCLSASNILPIAVNATLTEVEQTKRDLAELEELLLRLRIKPKCTNVRRVYILITGVGLVSLALFKICMTCMFLSKHNV